MFGPFADGKNDQGASYRSTGKVDLVEEHCIGLQSADASQVLFVWSFLRLGAKTDD
jgi:hypothetical protein